MLSRITSFISKNRFSFSSAKCKKLSRSVHLQQEIKLEWPKFCLLKNKQQTFKQYQLDHREGPIPMQCVCHSYIGLSHFQIGRTGKFHQHEKFTSFTSRQNSLK